MSSGVGGGLSKKNGGLTKNSVIKCSIDDLQLEEGLLVVSFAHKDNLYQGVLLQLNRERGIPAGISFPKDYFSGEKKPLEQNLIQSPPLAQRNTYFQETDNGRQYRLRRVIKTPARFKNSRMSLRPVQRPVLCAKCGALCNEKDKANSAEETPNNVQTCNGDTDNKHKKNGDSKKSPSTATNNKASTKDKLELVPKVKLSLLSSSNDNAPHILPVVEDPNMDYNYEGVGSVGIVDNAWKRPLCKPLKYQTRHQTSSKHVSRFIKVPSKIVSKNTLQFKSEPVEDFHKQETNQCPVFRITRAPNLKSSDKQSKANNLKLCIKKLTMVREAKLPVEENPQQPVQPRILEGNSTPEPCRKILSVPPMRIPIRKTKLKLKRRNSTMPFRLKDHKSPTWRTRKVSTMSNPDDKVVSPLPEYEFFNPLCLKEEIREVEIDQQKDLGHNTPSLPPKTEELYPLLSSDLSPIQSPEQFEDSDEGENLSIIKEEQAAKTPVIKITFGSSGNGVVVQIPPRNTNQNDQEEITENPDTKAARKALKKARKEAKRKQSEKALYMPQESSCSSSNSGPGYPVLNPSTLTMPSSPTTKPALAPLTIHLNSSSHNFSTSPTRISNQAELSPILHPSTRSREFSNIDSEGERWGKKKKKAKKRKRQKDHKENDLEPPIITGESHHQNLLITSAATISTVPGSERSSPTFKSEIMCNPSNLMIPPMISNGPKLQQRSSSISPPNAKIRKQEDGNDTFSISETPTCTLDTNPQRVCISLKRLKNQSNAYIPWNSGGRIHCFSSDEHDTTSDSAENEEPHDFQDTIFISDEFGDGSQGLVESLESYNHVQSNHQYKKGDVVWGKSTGCPWWPGKIVDIQLRSVVDVRAKIAWYKSSTQSCIAFSDLHPFEEYFDSKYTKNRKRGCYQQAVREALTDAHQ